MWTNPRAKPAVDCRETARGDMREEIVVEKSQAAMAASAYC